MSAAPLLLVVCGLNREARLLGGPGIVTVAGGGSRSGLERRLAEIEPREVRAVISAGLAGALDATLAVGDLVIPNIVVDETSARMAAPLAPGLMALADGIAGRPGILVGVDRPAMTRGAKADLAARSGAVAVDMESHVAAAFAARHDLPFGVLRVISDGAETTLPPIVSSAMRPNGGIDIAAIVGGLIRHPGQIPGLVATARDGARAFRVLGRVGGLLRRSAGLDL